MLKDRYAASRAIVIGIDEYQHVGPLGYAAADAVSIAAGLEGCGFPKANIQLLTNGDATKANILRALMSLSREGADPDDRIVFYFAGHGETVRARRSDTGFLVPVDGTPDHLDSLIRWDELTRGSELIEAKHVLFLMDACYGGLAIKRRLKPGAMRFLRDMLVRPARQVLTAGKADEVVDDLGGPLPGHSPFTGYLLEGLAGKAAKNGLLTANGLMSYVYEKLSCDPHVSQTPHYGYLDGDGDLILLAPDDLSVSPSADSGEPEARDTDTLVAVPTFEEVPQATDLLTEAREYLSEEKLKLRMHELVAEETRRIIGLTGDDRFGRLDPWSPEEFRERIRRYDNITADLRRVLALTGAWASPSFFPAMTLPFKRLADQMERKDGLLVWAGLRWYPVMTLLYAAGVAAVSAERYDTLRELFHLRMPGDVDRHGQTRPLVVAVQRNINDSKHYNELPGQERQYVPRSEYLFKALQPVLDDMLFLGSDYEQAFDRFEILLSLECSYDGMSDGIPGFSAIGRFGYKISSYSGSNPLDGMMKEAAAVADAWPPLKAGLFGGSSESFTSVADAMATRLSKLGWW